MHRCPQFLDMTNSYSFKEAVSKDLDRLQTLAVLEKIPHSNWAAPVVPVHICGDFKVTVNPQLKVDQYPLPRPEELFASLKGGQQYKKKLDFSW